jgi:8-oxo-dGTP diphosphatase
MKTIQVAAAIILQDNKVFATQRGYGDFEGGWEFPGGKIEPNEQPEDALIREIFEELATEISVDQFITTVEYDYPTFHLSLHCYICSVKMGKLTLLEHSDSKWLDKSQLDSVDWLPADIEVINILKQTL